jgi:iron complex outermembrane recepter protein
MPSMKTSPCSMAGRILSALLITVLSGFLQSVPAAEPVRISFDVPAGEASATLKIFSEQSAHTVVYLVDTVRGERTSAVRGEFTPRQALDRLLMGTELIAVTDAKTGSLTVRRENLSKNVQSRPADSLTAQNEKGLLKLETFEVFASKSINADLPRSRDDVQPYVVFGRDQIEASGATNLHDFFRTRLPMNNSGATFATAFNSFLNSSSVNLRGLGENQTLILVDGRRVPSRASGGGGNFLQSDVNGIPISMIERIEILPSTASGIHGGGATGGVVNIITKKDYAGVEATISYDNAFDTDVSRRRVELNSSFNVGGKTFFTFSSSYSNGTSLLVQDRDFMRRARALILANNPAAIYGPAVAPPVGYTTNIRNSTTANLVLKPQYGGTVLNSPYTHVPVGYSGIASDNAAALVANAGRYNLELPDTISAGGRQSLLSTPELQSLSFGARHSFGSRMEVYVDASGSRNISRGAVGTVAPSSFTLAAAAPNNPFTTPVVVSFPATGIDFIGRAEVETFRVAAGGVVRLPRNWVAGTDFVWGEATQFTGAFIGPGDPDGAAGPRPSFSSSLASGAVDVLRDLNVTSPDYAPYTLAERVFRQTYNTSSKDGTMRFSGPLWELPAGPATLAVSGNWRQEHQPAGVLVSNSVFPVSYRWFPEATIEVGSLYAEMRVPVFSAETASWLRSVEVQGSFRYDTFRSRGGETSGGVAVSGSDVGTPENFGYLVRRLQARSGMAGFKYSPVPDIALRASGGTGFLPPTISQLGIPTSSLLTSTLIDPKRGNVSRSTAYSWIRGGNPRIEPERSKSLSAGVIVTPRSLAGLRVSVDYTRIAKRDEMSSLAPQTALENEDLLPGSIVRAPLTAADQALGYTGGEIQSISTQLMNFARKQVEAWDFQVDYKRGTNGWGTFQPYLIATYQPRFASQVTVNGDFTNQIGFNGPVRWRGNVGLDWSLGRWSSGWNMQYYDSYIGHSASATSGVIAAFLLAQGTVTIPNQSYHDIYAAYNFGHHDAGWKRVLNDTRLSVSVQNFLNTSPPILAGATSSLGISTYGDPRLARYTITVRKRF